jgi:hypothetical protein
VTIGTRPAGRYVGARFAPVLRISYGFGVPILRIPYGYAGESPQKQAKRPTPIPRFSGVFARVCWLSPNTNQSGRWVKSGSNTGDSEALQSFCKRHVRSVYARRPSEVRIVYIITPGGDNGSESWA